MKRIVGYAEDKDVLLQLENLISKPELAEVHYLADNFEETIWYLDQIQSPELKWALTINHAHYDSIGIAGFVDGMGIERCDEVLVADNNVEYELQMHPGTGTVDFVTTTDHASDLQDGTTDWKGWFGVWDLSDYVDSEFVLGISSY